MVATEEIANNKESKLGLPAGVKIEGVHGRLPICIKVIQKTDLPKTKP